MIFFRKPMKIKFFLNYFLTNFVDRKKGKGKTIQYPDLAKSVSIFLFNLLTVNN